MVVSVTVRTEWRRESGVSPGTQVHVREEHEERVPNPYGISPFRLSSLVSRNGIREGVEEGERRQMVQLSYAGAIATSWASQERPRCSNYCIPQYSIWR
jgi:hypothetical protein